MTMLPKKFNFRGWRHPITVQLDQHKLMNGNEVRIPDLPGEHD